MVRLTRFLTNKTIFVCAYYFIYQLKQSFIHQCFYHLLHFPTPTLYTQYVISIESGYVEKLTWFWQKHVNVTTFKKL